MGRYSTSPIRIHNEPLYKIYTKPMNTSLSYEINCEDVNLVSLQAILDFHNIGKLQSMLIESKTNTLEIRIVWNQSESYRKLVQSGLHNYLHVQIPDTNIWIYKK